MTNFKRHMESAIRALEEVDAGDKVRYAAGYLEQLDTFKELLMDEDLESFRNRLNKIIDNS